MGAKKTEKNSPPFQYSHSRIAAEDVDLGSLLGKGTFASVYSAHLHPEKGRLPLDTTTNDSHALTRMDTISLNSDTSTTRKSSHSSCSDQSGDPMMNSSSAHPEKCVLKTVRTSISKAQKAISARDLCGEAKILKNLPEHENIIKLIGISEDLACYTDGEEERNSSQGAKKKTGWFLILERLTVTLTERLVCWSMTENNRKCDESSISTSWRCLPLRKSAMRLAEQEQSMRQNQLKRLSTCALGIAKAMQHLHKHRIIHRDLKPANIGFSFDDQVRLFDFGLATQLKPGEKSHKTDFVGSPKYMSAEMLACTGRCCYATDMWSYAIVLWEICSLQRPFECFKRLEHLRDAVVYLWERPQTKGVVAVPEIRVLLERCWDKDPWKRPTFAKIVEILEPLLDAENSRC